MLEITKYQTKDYVSCREYVDRNQEFLTTMAADLSAFEDSETKAKEKLKELDEKIEGCTK